MKHIITVFILITNIVVVAQSNFSSPLPTRQQLAWHETEYYLFMHFGPNTFSDKEWGSGNESASLFNPSALDTRQWCRIAKKAGAKGIIITAKHHDGFCLWPSDYSEHTVEQSKWKKGDGDVLKELSKSCREFGLKFGIYISPWDKNHPDYGTEKYNDVFVGMLKELLKDYGPIWELWWDGANGEGPNARLTDSFGQGKKQIYDWKRYVNTVRQLSPSTVIFSDVGPDIRWAGNEKGIAGDPNWNFLNTNGYEPGLKAPSADTLNHGNYYGAKWVPAECDVSIRPGWFWHENENSNVKTADQLFDIYLKSVGRGANLLLNVPPDNRGLIPASDSTALMEFKKIRDESFANNVLKQADTYYEFSQKDFKNKPLLLRGFDTTSAYYGINFQNFIVEFRKPVTINCIALREAIHLGQSVRKFSIVLYNKNVAVGEVQGTSIGRKRILTFPSTTVTSFRVYMEDAQGNDNVSGIAAYLINEKLIEQ